MNIKKMENSRNFIFLLIFFTFHGVIHIVNCREEWEYFAHTPYYIRIGYQKEINVTMDNINVGVVTSINAPSSCNLKYTADGTGYLVIDLNYTRKAFFFGLTHYKSGMKVKVGSDNLHPGNNHECSFDGYYDCHGMSGRYIIIDFQQSEHTWEICEFFIWSMYFRTAGPTKENAAIISSSYLRLDNSDFNTLVIEPGLLDKYKYGSEIKYSVDSISIPITWFTLQLEDVSLVESFICKRTSYLTSTMRLSVAYQLDSATQFMEYREDGIVKMFRIEATTWEVEHIFNDLFIAKNMRFHLFIDGIFPLFHVEARVKKASYPILGNHHYIASEMFTVPFPQKFSIILTTDSFVSSITVLSQTLKTYCVSYLHDGVELFQKKNPMDTNPTIFYANKEAALQPFYAKEVMIDCLDWINIETYITVHLKGLKNHLPDHLWHSSNLILVSGYNGYGSYKYIDYSNSNYSLIGSTDHFQKLAPEHVVTSNFIGADHLTQPDLGDFTIGFQMKSKLSFKSDKLTVRPYLLGNYEAGKNAELNNVKFEYKQQGNKRYSIVLMFRKIYFNPHSHYSAVNLKLGKVILGTASALAKVYMAGSNKQSLNDGDEVNYFNNKADDAYYYHSHADVRKKDFTLNVDETNRQVVDITDLWREDMEEFSFVHTLFIVIRPTNTDNISEIKLDHNFELEIFDFQIIIPKSIVPVTCQQRKVDYSKTLELTTDTLAVATGLLIDSPTISHHTKCAKILIMPLGRDLEDGIGYVSYKFWHWESERSSTGDAGCFRIRNSENINERFVKFPQPLRFKTMKVILETTPNAKVVPEINSITVLGENDIDKSNFQPVIHHPIFSAGLHDQNDETGTNIYLDQNTNIVNVDVQTKTKKYHVEVSNSEIQEYTTVSVVWKNNSYLQIYLDNDLKNEDKAGSAITATVNYHKSYYLFFGFYDFVFSYLYATFQYFFIMKKAMTGSKIVDMFKEADYFPLQQNSVGIYKTQLLLAPDCLCKTDPCPCESSEATKILNQTFSPYTFTWHQQQATAVTAPITVEHYSYIELTFPVVGIDLKHFKIVDARLLVSTSTDVDNDNACFYIVWHGDMKAIDWCNKFWMGNTTYTSPNISNVITWIAKNTFYQNNSRRIIFNLMFSDSNLKPTSINLTLSFQEPSKDLFWYEPAYITSNSLKPTEKVIFTRDWKFRMRCLKFSLKFVGDGFSFVLLKKDSWQPKLKLYPQFFHEWTEMNLIDPSTLSLVFLRSGTGNGYFAIKNMRVMATTEHCVQNENYVNVVTRTFEDMEKKLLYNNLPVPMFVFPNDENYQPLFNSTKATVTLTGTNEEELRTSDSFYLPKLSYRTSTFSVILVNNLYDFTITAMMFDYNITSIELTFQSSSGNDQAKIKLAKDSSGQRNLIVSFQDMVTNVLKSETVSYRGFPTKEYFVLQYSSFFNRLRVILNEDHKDFDWFINLIDIKNIMFRTNKVVCLQYFDTILDKSQYEAAKLCPTYVSEESCVGKSPCDGIFCDPTTGRFKRKTSQRYIDNQCQQILNEYFQMASGYFPMDNVKNGRLENLKNKEISIPFDKTIMSTNEPGVVDNALCYKSNEKFYFKAIEGYCTGGKCSVSMWMKHNCVSDSFVMSLQIFHLSCEANGNVLLQVNECKYPFTFANAFWYHLALVFKSGKFSAAYHNGQLINPHYENCGQSSQENQFLIFGTTPFCIDEMMYSYDAYTREDVLDIFEKTVYGILGNSSTPEEIKQFLSPIYLYNYSGLPTIDQHGYFQNNIFVPEYLQKMQKGFSEQLQNSLVHIEFSNIFFNDEPLATCYFKNFNASLSTYNYGFHYGYQIGPSYPNQVSQIPEDDMRRSAENIMMKEGPSIEYFNKTNVTISWQSIEKLISQRGYPLTGFQIHILSNQPTVITNKYSSNFLLDGLRPYKHYELYIYPRSTRGIATNRYNYLNFTTTAGEPYEAPDLSSCRSKRQDATNGVIECEVHGISDEEYGGPSFSSQYFLFDGTNIPNPELLDTLNMPTHLQFKEFLVGDTSNGHKFEMETHIPYHDFVIVSRSTSRNGEGFGVLRYKIVKSADGKPDIAPSNISIVLNETEESQMIFSWSPLPDDDDVWNSGRKLRKYGIRIGYMFYRPTDNNFLSKNSYFTQDYVEKSSVAVDVSHIVKDITNSADVPDYKDNIIRIYIGAKTRYIKNSKHYCIAFQNQNAPRPLKLLGVSTINSTAIYYNFETPNPIFWRGRKKFFVVSAYQCPDKICSMIDASFNTSDSEYKACVNHSSNGTTDLLPTYLSQSTFKHFCLHLNVDDGLEDYTPNAKLCQPRLDDIAKTWKDQIFTIHDLSHFRKYKILIHVCNEFNCSMTDDNEIETLQYKPTCPPQGISHSENSSTSISFNWDVIDEDCQNGVILNYAVLLRRERFGEMLSNITSEKNIYYENFEKHEQVCVKVAGITEIGEGVFSNEYCAHTAEDAPSIAPDFVPVDRNIYSVSFMFRRPTSDYNINGILRKVVGRYSPTKNNTFSIYGNMTSSLPMYTKQWNVNHKEFLNNSDERELTLEGLEPYTEYTISMLYETLYEGMLQSEDVFRTLETAPLQPPNGLAVDGYNSTSFNVSWIALSDHLWAGIPYQYCIEVDEYWRNKAVKCHRFCQSFENLKFSMNNLQPYTVNNITVFACTKVACSQTGSLISVLTNESAPVGLINDLMCVLTSTSILLNWTDLNIMDEYGYIIGYNISIVALDVLNPIVWYFVNTTDVSLESLREFTDYDITIRAVNSAGFGPTFIESYKTLEDLPSSPPQNITTEGIDATSIVVKWKNVSFHHRNGIILGYMIYYHQILNSGSLGRRQSINITNSQQSMYFLDGLVKGQSYNISMAAYTKMGVGAESQPIFSDTGNFVDGNWTLWTEWGGCSATCGGGISIRTRECENPRPENGGFNCTGISYLERYCGGNPCSGVFLSNPGNLNCTEFCHSVGTLCQNNILTNNRTDLFIKNNVSCIQSEKDEVWAEKYDPVYKINENVCKGYVAVPDIIDCSGTKNGDKNLMRLCNCLSQDDIGYFNWGEWSPCSRTCHESNIKRAINQRRRSCIFPDEDEQKRLNVCTGVRKQTAECKGSPNCPIDGLWGKWTEYGPCNQTCGYGYQRRTRECDSPKPKYGGEYCRGPSYALKEGGCNPHPCKVHGGYTKWAMWSYCEASCGNSTRFRKRYCTNPTPNYRGDNCDRLGPNQEFQNCSKAPCDIVDINISIRYRDRVFHWTLNYPTSNLTLSLHNEIRQILLKQYPEGGILTIEFGKVRSGSIIVDFTIYFQQVNNEQVIRMKDKIVSTGKFGDADVTDLTLNSTSIPCMPPFNITSRSISQTSLMVMYDIPACHGNADPTNIYIYYKAANADVSVDWTVIGYHPNTSYIIIDDLTANTKLRGYLLRATIKGNGPPSDEFSMETLVGAPTRAPTEVRAVSVSSNQIFVEWKDIPVEFHNGPLIGYTIRYKTNFEKTYQEKKVDYGYTNSLVENLKPDSLYLIEIRGFTEGGEGPLEYDMEKTLEGVPDIPVPNFHVIDMQAIDWWAVSWGEIPKDNRNGILRGYRLIYYMSYRSDIRIGGEPVIVQREFDIYTFYHRENYLVNYATYNVTVTGFTNAGNGPAPEFFAKTCKCLEKLFSYWYPMKPYVETNGTHLSGFFPDLIKDIVETSCGSCKGYTKSTLHFMITKTGDSPNWHKEHNLKRGITSDVDIGFPFYSKPGRTVAPDTIYVQVNPSIGFVMLVRDEAQIAGKVDSMILNVLNVWPLLLVSYCIATLFGILIWFTDQFMNPDEFNIGSSLRGPVIGFWFSFVTMTTVGYGDLTPRSALARSISMVWFLVGLILNGIVIGFIATALTSVGLPDEVTLYDSQAGVIMGTYEYRYAIRKNAKVSENDTYENVTSMLRALQDKKVELVIADAYLLGDVKSQLPSMYIKVKKTIDEGTGYGFALSGLSKVLQPDIEGLLLLKKPLITNFIKSMEDKVPRMELEQAGDATKDIFRAEADAFQKSAAYICSFIAVGTFLGIAFTCYKNSKKKAKVSPTIVLSNTHQFEELGFFIKETLDNLQSIADRYGKLHKEEIEKLATFKKSYKRKVDQIGVKAADDIVFDAFG